MDLLILGAGGHGCVAADCAKATNNYNKIYFLDNTKTKSELGSNFEIIGNFEDIAKLENKFSQVFVALGDNSARLEKINLLQKLGFFLPNLIHPSAIISDYSKLNYGSIICAGAVIGPCTSINYGAIINSNSSVDHNCNVNLGVHISPNACLCGNVNIGRKTWIGAGTTIINNINIGENCIIGAGALVLNSISDNKIYYNKTNLIN